MVQASNPVLVGGLIDNLLALETRSCRKWRRIIGMVFAKVSATIFFTLHSIKALALVFDARLVDRNILANVALQFNRDHWLVPSSRQHVAYPNSQYKAEEMKHQNKNGLQSTIYLPLTENCQTYLIPPTWWIIHDSWAENPTCGWPKHAAKRTGCTRCVVLIYFRGTHTAHAAFCTGIASISRRGSEGELTH